LTLALLASCSLAAPAAANCPYGPNCPTTAVRTPPQPRPAYTPPPAPRPAYTPPPAAPRPAYTPPPAQRPASTPPPGAAPGQRPTYTPQQTYHAPQSYGSPQQPAVTHYGGSSQPAGGGRVSPPQPYGSPQTGPQGVRHYGAAPAVAPGRPAGPVTYSSGGVRHYGAAPAAAPSGAHRQVPVHLPQRVHSSHTYVYHGRHFAPFRVAHYRWPHGWAYHRYAVGAVLPRAFWNPFYYVYNWAYFGLAAPGDGLQWVRYGPDLLLIDLATGNVINTIYGVFDESGPANFDVNADQTAPDPADAGYDQSDQPDRGYDQGDPGQASGEPF